MRTLLVLRHAKSDWDAGVDDHARPLAKRGRKAAARVGRFLALAGPRPDVIVSSTATRARDTAERVVEAAGWDIPVHATDALYEASSAHALEVVRALPDEAGTAMIVGHEPTLSDLVGGLAGSAYVAMPTGALATLELDVASWSEVRPGSGLLTRLIPARSLEGLRLRRALEGRGGIASADDQRS